MKAANLLIDDDGTVLLGDLGVAASLSDEESFSYPSGSSRRIAVGPSNGENSRHSGQGSVKLKLGKRKSFVGTVSVMNRVPNVESAADHSCFAMPFVRFQTAKPNCWPHITLMFLHCQLFCDNTMHIALLDGPRADFREAI